MVGGWIVLIMKSVANKFGKGGKERRKRKIIRMDVCGHSSWRMLHGMHEVGELYRKGLDG